MRKAFRTQDRPACAMPLPDDLSDCLVLNTVAAARTLLRRNDARLKPFGITVQQFALLAAIRFHPDEPVTTLTQRVLLDRTSLTRNLDVLERKGLVRRRSGTTGNVRLCELTKQGNTVLARVAPEWKRARSKLMDGVSERDAEAYLRVAKYFSRL
jgi:DNA-binding MarR family transcriptional regulator